MPTLAICVILAKIDTDVTWKIGSLEICRYADGQAKIKADITALFYQDIIPPRETVRVAGVPRFQGCGGLECHV